MKNEQKPTIRHDSRSAIYHCKNCGLIKTAPEKFLGKIAPCPHCNTKSRVAHSDFLQTLWEDARQHQKPRRHGILLRLREMMNSTSPHKTVGILLFLLLSATTALFFITP